MVGSKVVLFSGYARLPAGTVASELYGVMALVFLIDVSNGTIVDVECTLSTRLAERFLASLLIGKQLTREATDLIDSIQDVYQGTAKKRLLRRCVLLSISIMLTCMIARDATTRTICTVLDKWAK